MIPAYHTRGINRRIYLLLIFAHHSPTNCALHWAESRVFSQTWRALLVDHLVISLETRFEMETHLRQLNAGVRKYRRLDPYRVPVSIPMFGPPRWF